MPDPIIFVVDHDPEILKCIAEALERRFGADYRILTDESPTAALSRLERACERGEQVALVIADIWTSEMSGLEWLERAHEACPKASRCVLVGWGDGAGFVQVRHAIVRGLVDTYLIRPCGDPEERLYPVVSEILGALVPDESAADGAGAAHRRRAVVAAESRDPRPPRARGDRGTSSAPTTRTKDGASCRKSAHAGWLPAVIFGTQVLCDPTNSRDRADARRPPGSGGGAVRPDHRRRRARGAREPPSTARRTGMPTLVMERQTVGRPGGHQLDDPQLSRLPARHHRRGAGRRRPGSRRSRWAPRSS